MRYTVSWFGFAFEVDGDGVNSFNTNEFKKAIDLYNMLDDSQEPEIKDNEYCVYFSNGEWK